jgi:hypothetical protein
MEKIMKLKSLGVIFLILTTLLFAGCRTSPVYNVSDAALPAQDATEKDIARAIITAGGSLGWVMKQKEPGHIIGSLHIRDHVAIVDVRYDNEKYSITYKDSSNLKYDGTQIHSNYNGWITNLSNAINNQVMMLSI